MTGHFFNRSWTPRLAPIFLGTRLVTGLAVCGLVWGCADAPPEDVALLARVGDTEITAEALRAFEAGFDKDEQRARHRANLETLVDREVLLMEARARGLAQAGEVQAELAKREVKALADAMLRSQIEERSAATSEEIERAYAEQGWGEKVVAIEMYVLDKVQARQVLDLLARGRDFEDVGRQFAADPYYKVRTGETKRIAYSPFDKPTPVVEAVFGLAQGAVTEPIPLHQGYIIAQVVERRQVALVEVEDGIRAAVEEEKRKQLRQSYLRHLKWDLGTQYNEAGMQLAVEVLQGAVVRQTMSEAQLRTPVYAFEGFEMDVEEVVQAVRPSGGLWPGASADAVNQKLAEDHFPNKIMAHDARRKGLDQSEVFLQSRVTALDNLMLIKLRRLVLAETPAPEELELAAFYEANKHRFRSAAWAQLLEILVEDPAKARDLKAQIEGGVDMVELSVGHTERRKAEQGLIYVSQSQAPLLGETWMNAVMNAELQQLKGPIQTKGGYSLFKVVERYDEVYHDLDNERVRSSVTRDVREKKERHHFNDQLQAFRDKFADRITVFEEHLEHYTAASAPAEQ